MKRALSFALPLSLFGAVACDDAGPDDLEPEAVAAADEAAPEAIAAPDAQGRHDKGWHGKHGRSGKRMKTPEARAKKKLARFDADGDGAITTAELGDHRMAETFTRIDTDGDGRLVEAELVAWAREHRGKHGKRRHKKHRDAPSEEAPVAG